MTEKRIIYTNAEGGLSVVIPAPGVPMERVLQDVPADATNPQVVDASAIPSDRTFRAAWRQNGKKCTVDLGAAKAVCHNRRRAKRTAEFAPLDVEATIPAKAQQAEAARQQIRDKHAAIQGEIDAAADVAALSAILQREGL